MLLSKELENIFLLYGKKTFFFARQHLIIVFVLCVHFVYSVLTRLQTLLVGDADFCNQVRNIGLRNVRSGFYNIE